MLILLHNNLETKKHDLVIFYFWSAEPLQAGIEGQSENSSN